MSSYELALVRCNKGAKKNQKIIKTFPVLPMASYKLKKIMAGYE